ncbi:MULTISPECIES: hypothetical protein [unclassified Nocardia]|uniref:hypothetical protein n=1 Tax=unclassified Nocardia TaxID=2637762 RepID=UPI001CE450B3|nr:MULTISPECIES: hypothetical protein [unclassified Nocardia]
MIQKRSILDDFIGFISPISGMLAPLTGALQPMLKFVDEPRNQEPAQNSPDPDFNSPYGHVEKSQDPYFKGIDVFVSPATPNAPAATVFAGAARNIMGQHIVNAAEYWMTHSLDGRTWNGPSVSDLPRTGRPTWVPANGTPGTQYSWGGGGIDGPSKPPPGTENTDSAGGARQYNDDSVVGFDCAHLVEYAIYQGSGHKIDIGAYTVSQYNKVNELGWQHPDLKNLKPGDILWSEPSTQMGSVIGSAGKSVGAPAHVVIFSGYDEHHNPTYIEAPESGQKIREITMDQGAFESTFGMFTAARPPLAFGDPKNPYIQPQKHAGGGAISVGDVKGAGSSIGDKIPAYLSDGEFVVNAASASANRPLLKAINDDPLYMTKYVRQIEQTVAAALTKVRATPNNGGEHVDQSMTVHLSAYDVHEAFAKAKLWEQRRALTEA